MPKAKSPNETDKHVGARVRMRRMVLGLSQGKFGDVLGLSFQQVQKYEKGINRIGASRLQEIAQVLQVPVEFFFDGSGEKRVAGAPDPSQAFMADRRGVALMCLWPQIPDATRAAMLSVAEAAVTTSAGRSPTKRAA